jgi:hypothetical protein
VNAVVQLLRGTDIGHQLGNVPARKVSTDRLLWAALQLLSEEGGGRPDGVLEKQMRQALEEGGARFGEIQQDAHDALLRVWEPLRDYVETPVKYGASLRVGAGRHITARRITA